MDPATRSEGFHYGQQKSTVRRELRQIIEDLDKQDRALLRVSTELLDTIAALKEVHELPDVKQDQIRLMQETPGTAGNGPSQAGNVTGDLPVATAWMCTLEKGN
ncbi:uncharacterized protein LOC117297421 [Asterias rubens]|uniref:uncharacterized protein LOC117297421 n=1 Tax=Asterias rubens TaxID=7604 RepID=UPI001455DA59|nr:uncharacterized protein LOC117297421 [Asterias rubens]